MVRDVFFLAINIGIPFVAFILGIYYSIEYMSKKNKLFKTRMVLSWMVFILYWIILILWCAVSGVWP